MTPPRPDLQKLPPIARAQALHRPYRPGRSPMVYGLLITVAINLGWGAWALFGSSGRVLPDWAKPQEILIPATLLPALTTAPPPRAGAASDPAAPGRPPPVDASTEAVESQDTAVDAAAKSDEAEKPAAETADAPAGSPVPEPLAENAP